MNIKFLIGFVLLALIVVGAYTLVSWQNVPSALAPVKSVPTSQEMPVMTSGDNLAPESVVHNVPAGSPIVVGISNFEFQPKELRISVGTKVIWKNEDSIGHTVTSDTGAFDSRLFGKNETFEFTFNEKGTFTYYCRPHPGMKAKIIVE